MAWLAGWTYRHEINLDNLSGGALTNYPLQLVMNTQTMVANGYMQSDGDDIRITDSDETTILKHWVEGGINTTDTSIWFKVPSVPAVSTKTIYIYYGNGSATNIEDGPNVFSDFDDFNDSSLDGQWTKENDGGINSVSESANPGYLRLKTTSGFNDWWTGVFTACAVKMTPSLGDNFEVVTVINIAPDENYNHGGIGIADSTNHQDAIKLSRNYNSGQEVHFTYIGTVITQESESATTGILFKLRKVGTTYSAFYKLNPEDNWTSLGSRVEVINNLVIRLFEITAKSGDTLQGDFNYFFLKQYVNNEPTVEMGASEAAWMDANWTYREEITVNAGGSLTDHPVQWLLDTQTLVSAGKMQADGDDIRITDSSGITILKHWVEEGTINNTHTSIWFKAPSLISGDNKFYIYYGNGSATNIEDGPNVFSDFDDFNNSSIDVQWTIENSGGVNSISESAISGYLQCKTTSGTTDWWTSDFSAPAVTLGSPALSDNFEALIRFNVSPIPNADFKHAGFGIVDTTNNDSGLKMERVHASVDYVRSISIGGAPITQVSESTITGLIFKIRKVGTSYSYFYKLNPDDAWIAVGSNTQTISNLGIRLFNATAVAGGTQQADFNYFFVKKYDANEPAVPEGGEVRKFNTITGLGDYPKFRKFNTITGLGGYPLYRKFNSFSTIPDVLYDMPTDIRAAAEIPVIRDIPTDIRATGTFAEEDIDNDIRTRILSFKDIGNDIRTSPVAHFSYDINNDIRVYENVEIKDDIETDIRAHGTSIFDINNDIRVSKVIITVHKDIDIDVRAFDVIPVLRDINNDIRTSKEETVDIANDVRYKVSSLITIVVERSIEIKEGDYVNSQSVTLLLDVDFAGQMRFQNDINTGIWTAWETYTDERAWTLSAGDGLKKVYVQFKDIAGNETEGTLYAVTTLNTGSPTMNPISCYAAENGSSIADSTYQTDHSPYFEWTTPVFGPTIAGYKYTMDNATMGDDTNLSQPEFLVESGLVVGPNSGMRIQADIGVYYYKGERISYPTGTVLLDVGGAQDRIDLIYLDVFDNILKVVKGTEAVSPVVPDEPAAVIYLANVLVGAGETIITAGDITDKRKTKIKVKLYETVYLSSGTHKLRVRALGGNGNWSNIEEFNVYISSESPDIGIIECWRDNTKVITIADAVYQTADNTPYFEWTAPTAPGTMTYYYTLDGTIPDSGSSSTINNYLDYAGSPFGVGTHVLTVRAKDSFGTWGASRRFTFIYGTVSTSGDTVVIGSSSTLRQSEKEVHVHRVEFSLRSARICEFEEPVEFDANGSYNYGDVVTVIHNSVTVFRGVVKHIRRVLRTDSESIVYQAVGPRAELGEEYAYTIDAEIGATTQISYEDKTLSYAINDIVSKFSHIIKSVGSYPVGANITLELIGLPVDQALQRIYEESGHYGFYVSVDGVLNTVDLNSTSPASAYFGVYGQKISAHPEYDILSSDLTLDITGRYNTLVIEGRRKREIITVPAVWNLPKSYYPKSNRPTWDVWFDGISNYVPQTDKRIIKLLAWDVSYYKVIGWRWTLGWMAPFHWKVASHNKITEVYKDGLFERTTIRNDEGKLIHTFQGVSDSKVTTSYKELQNPSLSKEGRIHFNQTMWTSAFIGTSPGYRSADVFVTLLVETVPLKVTVTQSGSANSVAKVKRIYDSSFQYDEDEGIDDTSRMITFGENQLAATKDIKLSGSVLLDDVDTSWDLTKTVNLQNANPARGWNSINAKITSVTWDFDANTTNIELTTEYLGG